ncbi:uncharacterized protein LTR77_010693 [Saxophila tyrrhenica]|uniref:Kinetochore-associated protein MTW1 n=1 Tax=Saxophila tyrrhenica TaxID=1690608 RepID=A0AAV9NYQ7_9PEZI|nr:hypothetical protein LTR77_010693 [Saxophila tyrrhenica]
MANTNQMSTALLTEHFRYTPLTLLDDIINTVNELVFRAVNAVEEGLNNAPPESLGFKAASPDAPPESQRDAMQEAKQMEIDNGIVKLESLLNATVDKDFDKFEIYTLRNILAVGHDKEQLAGWVQLDHYKNLDLSRAEDAPTPEQVQLQRRKLHETTKLNTMLKAEEARNAAVLEQLRSLMGTDSTPDLSNSPFAFLTSSQQAGSGQTQNQNVQYAISQLPALRQHLALLKDSLQTLPNARGKEEDEDSVEAKRRRYIDSQSRKALQRRGVEPDNASVAGGTGRRVGREEVEGIEAVVQAFGGAEGASRRDDDEMEE